MRLLLLFSVLLVGLVGLLFAQTPATPPQPVILASLPDLTTPGAAYAAAGSAYDTQLRGNFNALGQQGNQLVAFVTDPTIGNAALASQIQILSSEIKQMTVAGAAPLLPQHVAFTSCTGVFKSWQSAEGLAAGSFADGATFDCPMTLPAAGKYQVILRAATPLSGCTMNIENPAGTAVGIINLQPTGGWANFGTMSPVTVMLPAGATSTRFV